MVQDKIRLVLWYHPSWEGGMLESPDVSADDIAFKCLPRPVSQEATEAFKTDLRSDDCYDYTQVEFENWGLNQC